VEDTFAEASEVLGYDLWALVQEGPAERLDRTEHTQPAMLAAGVAVWRVWRSRGGPDPVVLAGHSLGEYTALVAAEALGFAEAVGLVAERARLMQAAVPAGDGAMVAILGLDDAAVEDLCAAHAAGGVAEAVNYNAPGQVVVAGSREAVDRVAEAARAAGARRVVPLAVSVPSHSSLMRAAAERLAERLAQARLKARGPGAAAPQPRAVDRDRAALPRPRGHGHGGMRAGQGADGARAPHRQGAGGLSRARSGQPRRRARRAARRRGQLARGGPQMGDNGVLAGRLAVVTGASRVPP